MKFVTVHVVTSLATGYFIAFTADAIKGFFATTLRLGPSFEDDLLRATTSEPPEKSSDVVAGVSDSHANLHSFLWELRTFYGRLPCGPSGTRAR